MIYGRPSLKGDLSGSTAGPVLVRSRAGEARRPFVLKCPECTAPTASGKTKCAYCGAPLTWRPAISPMAFDDGFISQDVDDEPGVVVLPFGPKILHAQSTTVFQCQPQLSMRPTHLYVPERLADSFEIEDVRIGIDSWMIAQGAFPASMCSSGKGLRIFDESAQITVGVIASVIVRNASYENKTFSAAIRGFREPVRSSLHMAHPLDHWRRRDPENSFRNPKRW